MQSVCKKMSLKKEINSTFESIKVVLCRRRYLGIFLVSGVIFFSLLYYFLVAKVANYDILNSVMMSGAGFVTFSIVTSLATAGLSGILVSMVFFKFNAYNKFSGKGIFGFIGSGIAAFGIGCPTCGAFLFGLIGLPLALMYLPFKGLELQVLGTIVLIISIYFTGKSIKGHCKI